MRIIRFPALVGLVVLLLGSAVAPTAGAVPADQWPGWTPIQQPQWDPAQPWYSRTLVVQPTGVVSHGVPVTVLVPSGIQQSFPEPTFLNTFQQTVVPTLAGILPAPTLQNGLQVMAVAPHLHILTSPQFFCPMDSASDCVNITAQLAQRTPGWTTVITNGPLGLGAYVAHAS
jgi:hypothetical protein